MSSEFKNRVITSFFLIILLFLIFNNKLVLVYSLIILSVLSILEFLVISSRIISNKIYLFAINFAFIIYISIFCLFFFYFSNFYHLQNPFSFSNWMHSFRHWRFIFGKLIKGPKLTKISPKKQ